MPSEGGPRRGATKRSVNCATALAPPSKAIRDAMLTDQALLRLLQLTDTAFPTGAFAHSFGLETYVARGSRGHRGCTSSVYYQHITACDRA